jgi:hypothetical protein
MPTGTPIRGVVGWTYLKTLAESETLTELESDISTIWASEISFHDRGTVITGLREFLGAKTPDRHFAPLSDGIRAFDPSR